MERKDRDGVVEVEQTKITAKPNKEKLIRGLRNRHADIDLPDDVDDETLYGMAMDKHKEYERQHENMVADNGLLLDTIANSEVGKEAMDELLQTDEEGNSRIVDEIKRRAEELEQNEKAFEEFRSNLERSMEEAIVVLDEEEATDEERNRVFDYLLNIIGGNITGAMVQEFIQGLRYEEDVEDAGRAGEVRGRNSKIDASRLALRRGNDLPKPRQTATPPEQENRSVLGLRPRIDMTRYAKKI